MYWRLYWRNLHWLSVNYPENPNDDEKHQLKQLIEIMMEKDGLSCVICRNHFIQWVKKHDIDEIVKNKTNLFAFFWSCHNDVNKRKGKSIISYDSVYKLYTKKNWKVLLPNNASRAKDPSKGVNILLLLKNNKLKEFPRLLLDYCVNISNSDKHRYLQIERKIQNIEKNMKERKERKIQNIEKNMKERKERKERKEMRREKRRKEKKREEKKREEEKRREE
jgi:hypothetical protein